MYRRLSFGEFGGDSIVVADSAYPPNYFICKPLERVNTVGEQNYQYCQIKTRNVVERVNGQLKRRFAILRMGAYYTIRFVFVNENFHSQIQYFSNRNAVQKKRDCTRCCRKLLHSTQYA